MVLYCRLIIMARTIKIGVLVLQGAFAEHEYALQKCLEADQEEFKGITLNILKIRKPDDLQVRQK